MGFLSAPCSAGSFAKIEALRIHGSVRRPDEIKVAYHERNGDISVVMKNKESRILDVKVDDGVQTISIQLDN